MNKRPTIEEGKAQAMLDPEFKEEYEALENTYQMKRKMIAMRRAAGMSQEQMAEKLGTKKSAISRLESISGENSPRLATVEDYARVLGYQVKVEFEPQHLDR